MMDKESIDYVIEYAEEKVVLVADSAIRKRFVFG